jgi:hypothetical protein
MRQEHTQRRQPLSNDERDMLIRASDSDDVDNLKRLIENLQPTPLDLRSCSGPVIDGNHAQMMRYVLEQKYDCVDGFMVQRALNAKALQVLDVLKEFGWSDVNLAMGQIGPGLHGGAQTAL